MTAAAARAPVQDANRTPARGAARRHPARHRVGPSLAWGELAGVPAGRGTAARRWRRSERVGRTTVAAPGRRARTRAARARAVQRRGAWGRMAPSRIAPSRMARKPGIRMPERASRGVAASGGRRPRPCPGPAPCRERDPGRCRLPAEPPDAGCHRRVRSPRRLVSRVGRAERYRHPADDRARQRPGVSCRPSCRSASGPPFAVHVRGGAPDRSRSPHVLAVPNRTCPGQAGAAPSSPPVLTGRHDPAG
jgi:hypothetical protein